MSYFQSAKADFVTVAAVLTAGLSQIENCRVDWSNLQDWTNLSNLPES
jgi:hypothetical protein